MKPLHRDSPGRVVLAATALGDEAGAEIEAGLRRAKIEKARLVVCHVVPSDPLHHDPLFPGFDPRTLSPGTWLRMVERELSDRVDRVGEACGVPVELRVEQGDPAGCIATLARELSPALVVVGAPRSPGGPSRHGVLRRLTREASWPVLVARPFRGTGTVLAAAKLSAPGFPVLREASRLARLRAARLMVVHAVSGGPLFSDPFAGAWSAPIQASGADWVEPRVREALSSFGAQAILRVTPGDPAAVVLRDARAVGADLIVLGMHRRSFLERMIRSDVIESVSRGARSSVLIVPCDEEPAVQPRPQAA